MKEFKGIAVSQGISINEAYIIDTPDAPTARTTVKPGGEEEEVAILRAAMEEAGEEISRLKNASGVTADYADIFKFHQLMLKDPSLRDAIHG